MIPLSPNLRGILYMVLATGTFVTNDTMLKLATEGLAPFQVLFLRGISAALWGLPLVLLTGNWPRLGGMATPSVLIRALFELGAVLCFIVALANVPLADVTAINQTSPMVLLVGVALLYGDRIGWLRMALALVGFAGAVMVAQPGGEGYSPYALLGFGCAILGACRDLTGRRVPAQVPAVVVAYATILVVMAGAGIATLIFEAWQPVTGRHLLLFAAAGFFLVCGQFFFFLAYRTGATASVAPFAYMFAVWAVLSGVVVFGTVPNGLALAGIGLIVVSGAAVAMLGERARRVAAIVA